MSAHPATIAVVGATGAVGREALSILAERGHPIDRVVATASPRSVGQLVPYGPNAEIRIREGSLDILAEAQVAIFAIGSDQARELAPQLVARGVRVVDNSSAFRMDPAVPLVVPEVNPEALSPGSMLVANPNCSTIILLTALNPIRRAFGLERLVVSTYQAVSGAGLPAMQELEQQSRAALDGQLLAPQVFPEPCAFNVFPHESPLNPATGMNQEEEKLIHETARIWPTEGTAIAPTCARVPVMRSHCQSAVMTLGRPSSTEELQTALAAAPGVELLDDQSTGTFPTSLRAAGQDNVLVGRIRPAFIQASQAGEPKATKDFTLWLAGDQLRKGAALNALQISDHLLELSGG